MTWKKRRIATFTFLAFALLLGLWLAARHQVQLEQADGAPNTAAAQASRPSASLALNPTALPTAPSTRPTPPSAPLTERERRWQERDRAWCDQGTQVTAGASRKGPSSESAERISEALEKEQRVAWADLTREWEQTLRAQADPASQATAETLWMVRNRGADTAAVVDRLTDLAQRTRLPYVVGLAAQSACWSSHTDPKCQAALKIWLEVEPHNLQALQYSPPERNAEPAAVHLYMDRLMTARESRNPQVEFIQRLWNLEGDLPPGLRRTTRSVGLIGLWAATQAGRWSALTGLCKSLSARGGDPHRCGEVADHLWPLLRRNAFDETLLLALARTAPSRSTDWAARAEETEARTQWATHEFIEQSQPWIEQDLACHSASPMQDYARDLFMQGEIAALNARMPRDPAARAALAKRFRDKRGRGLLENPASGGGAGR
ncbi:hypothetical protein [Inhella gelatinilytica]|uniref:Uncharacterized protein n=1 Tax=Inhella gelatinilytica TaxID=2795030 RepID=A0A931IZ24_9BURK|nr:hypothetical protein [Inhella gelatinilytica]MBH9554231.1 hypothetical protein [Inhella gelatinilytica]